MRNYMEVSFHGNSINEGFARIAVSGFAVQLNPTLEDLADIKTAVSEAVTNSIVHGYENRIGEVRIKCFYDETRILRIEISDKGKGITNVEKARQPFYTTKPDMDRSGMGFTVMETFMDSIEIKSEKDEGTTVIMTKYISKPDNE